MDKINHQKHGQSRLQKFYDQPLVPLGERFRVPVGASVRRGGCTDSFRSLRARARRRLRTGALATAGVLVGGIVSFTHGNPQRSQNFMRLRVLSQALTLVAVAYGTYVQLTPVAYPTPQQLAELRANQEKLKQEAGAAAKP